jgi:hypothetical protein
MIWEMLRVWLVVLAPVFGWLIISPESAWRVLVSWRYANPNAVRPSSSGFEVRRYVALVVFAALVVLAAAWG